VWLVATATLIGSAQEAPPTTTGPDGAPATLGPSELTTPADPTVAPEIDAPIYLLISADGGQVLAAKGADDQVPVASLTKLMTAFLVARAGGWKQPVEVSDRAASQPGSTAELDEGEVETVQELLSAMLVTSANDAAYALAEHVSGSVEEFVIAMDEAATELGLEQTSFASPDGFDDSGLSTARDVARLFGVVAAAPGEVAERILQAAGTKEYVLETDPGEERTFLNRNVLLWLDPRVVAGKTGFTPGAGFCLAVMATEDGGPTLFAVVLGDDDEPFSDAEALLNFGFEGHDQQTFVEQGEEVDRIGDLPVVATRELTRLIPVAATSEPEESVNLVDDPADAQPGDKVGTFVVKLDGKVLGKVPLRAAEPDAAETTAAGDDGGGGEGVDTFPLVAAGAMLGGLLLLLVLISVVRSRRRTW
jgi:D-alanyl-D-alanine carboxypeptidase (penicillin-binding protein 5/6)